MTGVKAEPNADDMATIQEIPTTKKSKVSSSDASHSNCQALASKSVNQSRTPSNSREKELQMRKFESFLLKPGQVPAGKDCLTDSVKKEKVQAKSPVSSAATSEESSLREGVEPDEIPTKRSAEKDIVQPFKRRELNEKFEELSNFVEDTEQVKQLDNPGEYVKIDKLLYQPQEDENGSIFQELEQQSEREFCTQASSWSLQEWIQNGQHLLNTHAKLVGKLVKHRIELSIKFQVITNAINDRADALNAQGILVDQKLQRIKTLGEEILHII
ncbi:hypothetical protein ZYGR_0N05730 [Zygosaccharomyces rouxii]|uniref:Extracellular mutant protein 11 C-terminal domain-containing protein n=1 Tax=Zygosaccharomyces rouxii TaxID=4956 RepID=A0A1Q3A0F5_ZYGRO|nr:hypothetical protein ZYGR_0N05730 [Zygosaccharomyces rouxii]